MKYRNGFVTNSSSSHYIVSHDNVVESIHAPLETMGGVDGVITIQGDEYGWSGDTRSSPDEKLSYIVSILHSKFGDEFLECDKLSLIREAVFEHTGCYLEVAKNESGYYPYGYVDHQSTDVLDEYFDIADVVKFKARILEFIFSSDYSVVIDNDNH